MLTKMEVQTIEQYLENKGITMTGLDCDLLDHLVCATEMYISRGHSFSRAFQLALYDLHGEEEITDIQKTTAREINDGKSFIKNLAHYSFVLGILIGAFTLLIKTINPALILTCITLSIFFVYHSIFQKKKHYSLQENIKFFKRITWLPVTAVFLFLIVEFKSYGLLAMLLWCGMIISIAIPVYLMFIKRILITDSSFQTFLIHTLKLTTVISVIWIPLAFCIKLFRSDIAVLFFIDDFFILAISSFILTTILQKLPDFRLFLRDNF